MPNVTPPKVTKVLAPRKTGIRYKTPAGEWKEHVGVGRTGKGVARPSPEKAKFDFGENPQQRAARVAKIKQWKTELEGARASDRAKRKQKSAAAPIRGGKRPIDTSKFGQFSVR